METYGGGSLAPLRSLSSSRLRSAYHQLKVTGFDIIGLETANRDHAYEWRIENGSNDFLRQIVFPQRNHAEIAMCEMWRRGATKRSTTLYGGGQWLH